jgi:hypothetical protein
MGSNRLLCNHVHAWPTLAGDNSVDIFTNDIGVVVMSNDQGEVQVRKT